MNSRRFICSNCISVPVSQGRLLGYRTGEDQSAGIAGNLQPVSGTDVRGGSMLLKKDYEGGLLATLIQDQEQMRNHDLRNHLPGFVRFNF